MRYTPTITVKIPTDISAASHDAIRKGISDLNGVLAARYNCSTASHAREIAARHLYGTAFSACGYADALRGGTQDEA